MEKKDQVVQNLPQVGQETAKDQDRESFTIVDCFTCFPDGYHQETVQVGIAVALGSGGGGCGCYRSCTI